MDETTATGLIIIAVISLVPALLTGSILKKHARENDSGGLDWIPFGMLYYGLRRFQHPQKLLIVWANFVANMIFWGAVLVLVLYWEKLI